MATLRSHSSIDIPVGSTDKSENKPGRKGATLSTNDAFWHCMTLVLGMGTLSMPYVLKGLGWFGLVWLAGLAWLSAYTAKLLCVCIDYRPSVTSAVLNTYSDLGYAAFGKKGRTVVTAILYIDLVASSALFLVFIAVNLEDMLPQFHLDRNGWIILVTVSVFPTVHMKLQNLSHLSKWGSRIMFFLVVAVVYAAITAAPETLEHNEYHLATFELQAVGNMVFAFACHGTLLTVYREMRNPKDVNGLFTKVYATGYLLKFAVGSTGYYLFAQNCSDQISLMLPQWWLKIAITSLVTAKKWLTYALPLEPVAVALEEKQRDKAFLIRSGLVVLTCALALILPHFGLFQSLIGAFCAGFLVLIFPLLLYLKLFGRELTRQEWWFNFGLLIFSCWLIFVATVHTFVEARQLWKAETPVEIVHVNPF